MSGGRKSLGGVFSFGDDRSLGIGDVMSLAHEGSFDGVDPLGMGDEGPFDDGEKSFVWASENAPVHKASTVGISGASTSATISNTMINN